MKRKAVPANIRIKRAMRANEREVIRIIRRNPDDSTSTWHPHAIWAARERLEKAGVIKFHRQRRLFGKCWYTIDERLARRVMRARA
jgi:hypothetical protein